MATPQNYLAVIKVVGIGGGGVNAINRMIEFGLKGVEFVAINTDAQQLLMSDADVKLDIGREITKGLGAGANPEVGRQAAEDHAAEIEEVLRGSDMVFITAGEGGVAVDMVLPARSWMTAPRRSNGNALAVTGNGRHPTLPDVQSMAEAGFPGVDVSLWEAVLAPAATPVDIINKLNAEVVKAAQNAEVRQRLAGAGADPATGTPQQLAQMIRGETAKWAKVVKDAKIAQE